MSRRPLPPELADRHAPAAPVDRAGHEVMAADAGAAQDAGSATGVAWDLSALYAGPDDPALDRDLAESLRRAQAFETAYRGKIAVDGGPSAETVLAALIELESLSEQADRPLAYAFLRHAAKTDVPEHGALKSRVQEARAAVNKHLIFFDLEWTRVAEDAARRIGDHPSLAKYRHNLAVRRMWAPHQLGEAEEKILEEKYLTGRAAFVRLFDDTVSTLKLTFTHGGNTEVLGVQRIISKLYDPDRSVRIAAHKGLTEGLAANSRLLGYILNTIAADHKIDCSLRRYPTMMTSRNLSNEIDEAGVEALMSAVERNTGMVHRYYRLKGRLVGLDKLYDYDRYAPVGGDLPKVPWSEARAIVQESYTAFHPEAGRIVAEFFDKRWIDAELRAGKRTGAFSSPAVPSAHPYILMSYTDKLRDVMTLAHELGHGVHQYLSRQVGYLECGTPLTTAEMASVFGEFLTFRRLLERHPDPATRLALLCSKIEDAFSTVFRQVVLTRFEQSVHKNRRESGELSADRMCALWLEANRPMFGTSVELTEGYGWWWSYIGHFINSPFYCYAYAFGELLVLALLQKYKQEGAGFAPRYMDLLSRGGSDAPPALLARMGVDITDPRFWDGGLGLLDGMVTEAEAAAAALGR